MHIYARFSGYRIFADKKRCISCGMCTRVCHMGIDVMSYASRGKPMDDVECVRCSACVVTCPLQVLTFGATGNRQDSSPLVKGWQSGLGEEQMRALERTRGA
jgi:ferredoxin